MDSAESAAPGFYVCHHEANRTLPVTPQLVQLARACNYDTVTTPIITSHFHSRVLTLLSSHLSGGKPLSPDSTGTLATSHNTRPLSIPRLSSEDSHLTPNDCMSSVVAATSSWIDLCSPDPLIADVSRQVLSMEIDYASFCGVGFVVVPGPRLHHGALHGEGVMYYARAIQEVLSAAPYIQIHIGLRMVDHPDWETTQVGDLAPFARFEYVRSALKAESSAKVDVFGTWDAWNAIRTGCKYHCRLFVALSLPKYLPPIAVQSRWYSEPVRILNLDTSSFIKNQKGYPVLSKAHQALIFRFMRLRSPPWIILSDVGSIPGQDRLSTESPTNDITDTMDANMPTPAQASQLSGSSLDPTPHLSYIRNLQRKQPPQTPIERFGIGYQDYLQAPLQPLTVNLESITYEVFEKDPIKYDWYESAIARAMSDWKKQKKPTSRESGRIVVAVVGAGRGPLVTRAILASVEAEVDIELWALEKNPNAFVHLEQKNQTTWDNTVKLVQSDMRSWKGPHLPVPPSSPDPQSGSEHPVSFHKVDILISELLGSFGDNELSPECLDGVTHLLNPIHGISIPASYSAHLTPIAAPRLHAEITSQVVSNPAAPETPYVVMLHAIDYLSSVQSGPTPPAKTTAGTAKSPTFSANTPSPSQSADFFFQGQKKPQAVAEPIEAPAPIVRTAWSFSHPNPNVPSVSPSSSIISNAHNVRHTRLTFPCRERGLCHGLAGYFETVLYGDVELSTNPLTMEAKSSGMISWFPIFFPLKTPLYVPDNAEITVTMFRQTDNRKVWYEWMVEVFALLENSPPTGTGMVGHPTASQLSLGSSSGQTSPGTPDKQLPSGAAAGGAGATSPTDGGGGGAGKRRVRVAMSEMHSSIKDGCLM